MMLAAGIPANELCEACLLVSKLSKDPMTNAAVRITSYNKDQWEHSYISETADGFVVTEHQRINESKINKQEKDKFEKELSMCKVLINDMMLSFLRVSAD